MMHNWFECKVSYMKMMENGMHRTAPMKEPRRLIFIVSIKGSQTRGM